MCTVGKRHHAGFLATENDAKVIDQKNGNPRNGTVINRHTTDVRNWDSCLQSHAAIQGTARPAHYFVIVDEIFDQQPPPLGTRRSTGGADTQFMLVFRTCHQSRQYLHLRVLCTSGL